MDRLVVRPSPRRRRTATLRTDGTALVLLVPAGLDRPQEAELALRMLGQMQRRQARRERAGSDAALLERALYLRGRHLPQVPRPSQVRWSDDQITRWGSCTGADATIRISTRLRPMPQWVVDHVLMHELVHLLHPDHGPGFQELLARCPRSERARGFLEGWSAAEQARTPDQPPGRSI